MSQFFGSLLPGIRDLRNPLASGWLVIASIWVLAAGNVVTNEHAHGLPLQIYDVTSYIGKAAVIAILTFAAYLVGSLITVSPSAAIRRPWRFHRKYNPVLALERPASEAVIADVAAFVVRTLLRARDIDLKRVMIDLNAAQILPDAAIHKVQRVHAMYAGFSIPKDAYKSADSFESQMAEKGSVAFNRDVRNELKLSADAQRGKVFSLAVAVELVSEIPQLATRLHAANAELFNDYDRAHAESEFRFSIILPLTALLSVLAIKGSLLFLIGFVFIPWLLLKAYSKEREANDVVLESLCADVMTSGYIDRIQAIIEQKGSVTGNA